MGKRVLLPPKPWQSWSSSTRPTPHPPLPSGSQIGNTPTTATRAAPVCLLLDCPQAQAYRVRRPSSCPAAQQQWTRTPTQKVTACQLPAVVCAHPCATVNALRPHPVLIVVSCSLLCRAFAAIVKCQFEDFRVGTRIFVRGEAVRVTPMFTVDIGCLLACLTPHPRQSRATRCFNCSCIVWSE